eukprot:gene29213-35264_t
MLGGDSILANAGGDSTAGVHGPQHPPSILARKPSYSSAREQTAVWLAANVEEQPSSSGPKDLAAKAPQPRTLKKIIPLGLMLFFILFNYTILRDTKDVLVTYVNLPTSIGFTILYSFLSNRLSSEGVFYAVMTAFIAFFGAVHIPAPRAAAPVAGAPAAAPAVAAAPAGAGDAWGVSLRYLMGAVVCGGGLILGIMQYMQRCVLTDPLCVPPTLQPAKTGKKKKTSMSLGESIKFLAQSPYI